MGKWKLLFFQRTELRFTSAITKSVFALKGPFAKEKKARFPFLSFSSVADRSLSPTAAVSSSKLPKKKKEKKERKERESQRERERERERER